MDAMTTGHGRRGRAFFWLVVGAALAVLVGFWQLGRGEAASESMPIATAKRGNLVVTVGGVGRIVQTGAPSDLSVPSTGGSGASGSGSTGGSSASAPHDAVFPRAAGRIARLLVSPGKKVFRGMPIAVLDDGGNAASASRLARLDLATAQLELKQKRTSDPLKGLPATPAELAAASAAVTSAKARLARLLSPPRPADVAAVRLELRERRRISRPSSEARPLFATRGFASPRRTSRWPRTGSSGRSSR